MKKYLVVPGYIISENDGDVHYIGAGELIRLYGVDASECDIVFKEYSRSYFVDDNRVVLEPRNDGDYTLPIK